MFSPSSFVSLFLYWKHIDYETTGIMSLERVTLQITPAMHEVRSARPIG